MRRRINDVVCSCFSFIRKKCLNLTARLSLHIYCEIFVKREYIYSIEIGFVRAGVEGASGGQVMETDDTGTTLI